MDDEMRFHIEMDAERRIAQGVDAEEARRLAAVAFGGVEKYRGASRDVLGFSWARGLSVDLKLGSRMLAKYPGLTLVAVFALSLAIGAGAAYLEFINDLMHGKLPFAEGRSHRRHPALGSADGRSRTSRRPPTSSPGAARCSRSRTSRPIGRSSAT